LGDDGSRKRAERRLRSTECCQWRGCGFRRKFLFAEEEEKRYFRCGRRHVAPLWRFFTRELVHSRPLCFLEPKVHLNWRISDELRKLWTGLRRQPVAPLLELLKT